MARVEASKRDRQLTVGADASNLALIRDHVAAVARASGADDDVVDQLELVVSELATNAIQYDPHDSLTVVVRADCNGWTIDVSNADGLVDIDSPSLPEPGQLSGRGLFIVESVMDHVELVRMDGRRHIRCVKHAD